LREKQPVRTGSGGSHFTTGAPSFSSASMEWEGSGSSTSGEGSATGPVLDDELIQLPLSPGTDISFTSIKFPPSSRLDLTLELMEQRG
jgi:hypothetical protein